MDLLHLLPFKQVSLVTVYSQLLYCTFQPMICVEYFCCTDWAWQSIILKVWKFLKEKKARPSKVYIHILVFVWFYLWLTKIIFFRGGGRGRVWGQSKCTCAEWVSAFIKDWIQLHVLLYACVYHVVEGREFLNTFLVSDVSAGNSGWDFLSAESSLRLILVLGIRRTLRQWHLVSQRLHHCLVFCADPLVIWDVDLEW